MTRDLEEQIGSSSTIPSIPTYLGFIKNDDYKKVVDLMIKKRIDLCAEIIEKDGMIKALQNIIHVMGVCCQIKQGAKLNLRLGPDLYSLMNKVIADPANRFEFSLEPKNEE
jgi:hypothetical protein